MAHPCQSCGACCAAFRVSFHWLGLASAGGAIPDALAEPVGPHRMAMKGTDARAPHCAALEGRVPEVVAVGDAVAVRPADRAIWDGHQAARAL